MNAEQWQQIKMSFSRALELPPQERAAYLDSLTDPVVRAEVASLLASHRDADDPMEIPAIQLDDIPPDDPEHDPWIGQQIGVYHVISRIGHGGMGVVYRAVRAGDHFVKHVALKVVRAGIGGGDVIRRFKNERQILASLEHANIARLLDGGTTESGLPYLIMEYIDGKPLDEYCDSRRLPISERLALFQSICAAVQYAHQNLVVHRDIKPGNILVTAEGVPKLLDFGIAKLLEPQLYFQTADPTFTFRPMTPEYASPEQIRGESITTSSDIYSLGIVLYLLLTGHHPYKMDRRLPHELARTILETELERPSTALKRVEEINNPDGRPVSLTPETVAMARSERPETLRKRLSGDLDNIVLKALRKDPDRRYVSVAQFSEDISRHLEGLPVIARKDTLKYRASKFVRRHRVGVAAAAAIFLLLIAGMIATTWQSRIARAQRAIADQRFEDVRTLATSLIFDVHDAIQELPGATQARQLIVRKALRYLDNLSKDSEGDPTFQLELTAAYQKLGDVQSYIYGPNLGDTAGAAASYGKALQICESLSRAAPQDIRTKQQLSKLYGRFCALKMKSGDLTGALGQAEKGLALLQSIADFNPKDRQAQYDLGVGFDQIGDVLFRSGRRKEALACRLKEQVIFEAIGVAPNASLRERRALSICYVKTGRVLAAAGGFSEALRKYEQALTILEALPAAEPMNPRRKRDLSAVYTDIGETLAKQGDSAGSLERYRMALDIVEALVAADTSDVFNRLDLSHLCMAIGDALSEQGRFTEARKHHSRAVAAAENLSRLDPTNAEAKAGLAQACASFGRMEEKIASASTNRPTARRIWLQARSWYERSQSVWLELRNQKALMGLYEGKPQESANGISRCNSALRK